MTANGEVQTREEATENVEQLNLFVTVMLLEQTPAALSMYHLWFLVYQRVLPLQHLHLLV